ncbi:response regulator [Truepera radiovictrix]|uniref:Response regulator receiver and SARP domain protein n=1 Tax=Truepera radiovictrix (strain DSM 17093 / CIP 108686 / LMG 22925 / RQ-24) TaxID=649638 RepID=D7CT93_TRURR|nr:response regulator [Truepera radiovictrix]ADI15556.1 response regulator receiver and SARP domain protein [Truepera radiovictrix DSM 17093]WMT58815.1 response regulator [Truepera radiovictrix]
MTAEVGLEHRTDRLVVAVDDEPSVRKLIDLILSAAGFSVLTFERPQDALSELESGLRPDVIVSDVTMPGMDGFAFCRAVRATAELRAVPFLFLTALDERASMRQGMLLGADDYLTKPFVKRELVEAVERRLARFAEIRRPAGGKLRVYGFGSPTVERDAERLEWDSLKALELLFYLLEHPRGVSTFEVAEALWPGKTEAKASSSFHTTLYRLRKVIGGEVVRSANRRYYLQGGLVLEYDVARYRALAAAARRSGALADYARGAELYRADFLLGVDSAWAETTRLTLHTEHLALLVAAAELADRAGDYEAATRFYSATTLHEPYSESAWEALANLWERRGHLAKAAEVRGRFESLMSEL